MDHMWCKTRVGNALDRIMWCKPLWVMRLKDVWGKVWPGGAVWSLANAAGIYDFGTFLEHMSCFDVETGWFYFKALSSIVLSSCTRFPLSNLSSIFLLPVQTVCSGSFQSWSGANCVHLSTLLSGTSQCLLVHIQLKSATWIFSLVWSAGSNKKATVIIIIIITESDGALVIEFCSHAHSLKNKCSLSLPVLNLLIIKQTALFLSFLFLIYCFLCFLLYPQIIREERCPHAPLHVLSDTRPLWLDY